MNGSIHFLYHKQAQGWRKAVDFTRMQSNPDSSRMYVLPYTAEDKVADWSKQNRLRFVVKLTETVTSDQMEALKAPSFSLLNIASGITGALA
jgi:hypothetical protein